MADFLFFVPIGMFAFVLFKLKNTPLVLASLPIFFSLGEAGFIDAFNFRIALPLFYPLNFRDFSIFLLVLAALYANIKWSVLYSIPKSILYKLFNLLLIFILFYIPLAWFTDMKITPGTIWALRTYTYIPISVYLWLSIFRRCRISHLENMFNMLMKISLVGAILYSLSSVGLSIFPYTSWESGQGFGTITRDFNSFPPYLMFALGFLLFTSRLKVRKSFLFYFFVFFISVLLTYTRSWIFAFIISIIIPLTFSQRKKLSTILLLLVLPVALLISFRFVEYFAPNSAELLVDRFSEFSVSVLPSNAVSRIHGFSGVFQHLSCNSLNTGSIISGAGWSLQNAQSYSSLDLTAVMLGDSFWAAFLFHFGLLGVGVMVLLLGVSLSYSFSILSLSKYSMIPRFLRLSTVTIFWISIRTTSSNEFIRYPVIMGLAFSTLILAYVYPSITFYKPILHRSIADSIDNHRTAERGKILP